VGSSRWRCPPPPSTILDSWCGGSLSPSFRSFSCRRADGPLPLTPSISIFGLFLREKKALRALHGAPLGARPGSLTGHPGSVQTMTLLLGANENCFWGVPPK
jgi:hypothetical protein